MAGEQDQGALDVGGCPDDETLAAYVDRCLPEGDTARFEQHVAGCDRCVEWLAAMAEEPDADQDPAPGKVRDPEVVPLPVPAAEVVSPPGRPRRLTSWAAPLAASMILVVGGALAMRYVRGDGPGLESLRAATQEQRPTLGRLTQFAYAPPLPTHRSSTVAGASPSVALLDAAAAVEQARSTRRDAGSLHAYGVALLLAGEVDSAIATLTRAVTLTPRDPALLNDAATAWLQQGQTTSDSEALLHARRLAEQALAIAPQSAEAWFNLAQVGRLGGDDPLRARALERLQSIEAGSPWVRELEVP